MTPLKKILAATDLSAPASVAAERAALVAKQNASSLSLFHVANLTPLERLREMIGETPVDMEHRVLDVAKQKLLDFSAELQQRYGIPVGVQVRSGNLLKELALEIGASQTDLLVCGAIGESIVRHYTFGTTASRILSTAHSPVLVVRQPATQPYQRLLIPVDFSPGSQRAIQTALSVAPGADIVLFHAFDVPFEGQLRYACVEEDIVNHYRIIARQEALQKLQELRNATGLSPDNSRLVITHGDPTTHIIEKVREYDRDLIVICKHGNNLVEDLLLGSVTKQILAESRVDVLVSV